MANVTQDPLDPARLKYILVVAVLAMAATGVCAWLHLGWVSAWVVTLGALVATAAYAVKNRDTLLWKLMAFGFVTAIGEILGADRWAVGSGHLVYAPHGPFVVDSPGYMLASWTVATVQFSLLGLWLRSKMSAPLAALACAVIGGTQLPLYESLAFYADWWTYQNAPMIFHAPWYVILGEVFIGAVFPWTAQRVVSGPWSRVLLWGALLGLWMLVGALIAFRLVG